MRKPGIYIASIAILSIGGVFVFSRSTRAGYESAEYTVVESDGNFEVRQYPDLTLVATATQMDAQGRDGSFMKLFRYISGGNESDQKIAMTTPVFMENDKADSHVQMGFVMPKNVAAEGIPAPTGEGVAVRKRTGGRFAVLRFSGRLDAKLAKESEAELRDWMETRGLVAADDDADDPNQSSGVEAAAYDPPFIPGPLRRNEILIRLK
jgi:hypothetical protein